MVADPELNAARPRLEIISDVVCPWCYIGKHRLERGLALIEDDIDWDIRWRPFELNPQLPPEGMDRDAYGAQKFGSADRARQIYANIAANAEADGLEIAVNRIARTPNTRRAHRLIALGGKLGCQNVVVDALFRAYFVSGLDVGDEQVLRDIGTQAGLPPDSLDDVLAADAEDHHITALEQEAQSLGVHGVPAFVFNGRLLFSGAQSAQTISLSLKRAIAKGL